MQGSLVEAFRAEGPWQSDHSLRIPGVLNSQNRILHEHGELVLACNVEQVVVR